MNKTFSKIISWLVVLVVLGFLFYHLLTNWQSVKDFDFSFNYFYLILSFLLLASAFIALSMTWNYILRKIEPNNRLSQFEALKIYMTGEFGKYVPGKVWNILGMVYLGAKKGLSKKSLLIASALESVLSAVVMLLVGVCLLSIFLGGISSWLYLISFLVIAFGLVIVQPKVFYFLLNLVLKKLKRPQVDQNSFLGQKDILKLILFYIGTALLFGLAFFFFVQSIAIVSWSALAGIVGTFCLATSLGMVALFAPSGLGIRDGLLVAFLLFYFPLGIATLLSFLARLWTTLTEILLFSLILLYDKLRKLNVWNKNK